MLHADRTTVKARSLGKMVYGNVDVECIVCNEKIYKTGTARSHMKYCKACKPSRYKKYKVNGLVDQIINIADEASEEFMEIVWGKEEN